MNATLPSYKQINPYPVTTEDFFAFMQKLETSLKRMYDQGVQFIQGQVTNSNNNQLSLSTGEQFEHDIAIIATGLHPSGLNYPSWYPRLKQQADKAGIPMTHSLDLSESIQSKMNPLQKRFFVVGSGANAINAVANLIEQHGKQVVLITRRPFEENPLAEQTQFVNPHYVPKQDEIHLNKLVPLFQTPPFIPREWRTKIIQEELPRGINKSYMEQCKRWVDAGQLDIVIDPNYELSINESTKKICLNDIQYTEADGLVVSTGFALDYSKNPLFQNLIRNNNLAIYQDGLAQVDNHLTWNTDNHQASNIKVTGYMASHRLGPNSLNAAGATIASEMIAEDPVFRQEPKQQKLNRFA